MKLYSLTGHSLIGHFGDPPSPAHHQGSHGDSRLRLQGLTEVYAVPLTFLLCTSMFLVSQRAHEEIHDYKHYQYY